MPLSKSGLRPITTPHPVIVIITLVVAGLMVFVALDSKLHPPVFLYMVIIACLVGLNQWSRMRRAKAFMEERKTETQAHK